jgi:serine/threonine protein kinase
MIGEVLYGFRLKEKLGESHEGETYLGVHQASGQNADVQVLSAALSVDPRLPASLAAASQVKHPGVVVLLANGVHGGGRAVLVTEHLVGQTLSDALGDLGRVLDLESFAEIGWQLADLLHAAHGAGVVHGALRADRVFLTFPAEGVVRVKLLGFGMARLCAEVGPRGTLLQTPSASTQTPGLDSRHADLYSLGCILYEMAHGRAYCARVDAPRSPPPTTSLPGAVQGLIGRMLSEQPSERPPMADVAKILADFRQSLERAPPVGPTLAVTAPHRQDPTALLPPDRVALPRPATWVGRARERTALLDPPAAVYPVDRQQARQPPAVRSHARAISLPVVIVTAAIVVAAGAAVLLRVKRPARPPKATPALPHEPSVSEGPPAAVEPLSPPVALPPVAEPSDDPESRGSPAGRGRLEKRRSVRRW